MPTKYGSMPWSNGAIAVPAILFPRSIPYLCKRDAYGEELITMEDSNVHYIERHQYDGKR